MKPGDHIKDNDPRMYNRVLEVLDVGKTHVTATRGLRWPTVKIRRDRIHTDDKPRRSGFSLVKK